MGVSARRRPFLVKGNMLPILRGFGSFNGAHSFSVSMTKLHSPK